MSTLCSFILFYDLSVHLTDEQIKTEGPPCYYLHSIIQSHKCIKKWRCQRSTFHNAFKGYILWTVTYNDITSDLIWPHLAEIIKQLTRFCTYNNALPHQIVLNNGLLKELNVCHNEKTLLYLTRNLCYANDMVLSRPQQFEDIFLVQWLPVYLKSTPYTFK